MSRYISKHTGPVIDAAIDRANGYGLGGGAKFITSGDLNDYKNCGWYAWDEGVSNVPFAYGSCIVLNKGGYYIAHQIAVAGFGQNICIRRYYNPTDAWDAWEWVNPPMQTGEEYRTTERYNGKPVFKVALESGALIIPGTTDLTGTWDTKCTVINTQITIVRPDGSCSTSPNFEDSTIYARHWTRANGTLAIKAFNGLPTGTTVKAVISYVKN